MKEEGIVIDIEAGQVVIETVLHEECKGCKTCGAGKPRRIVVNEERKDLKKGDKVTIEIDPAIMLKLYTFLYAAPLLAFMAALLTVYGASKNPLSSFGVAIVITGITYLGVGKYIKNKKEFLPKIIKREEI